MLSSASITEVSTFRERLRAGETLVGCFLNTGSPVAAEICALAGYDWLLIDLEHGSATESDVLPQLQAISGTGTPTLVRVEANERARFTKALDLGAEGVMVPGITGSEDARRAVSHLRYGPEGVRGVAMLNRAAGYGAYGRETVETFNKRAVGVVQIERLDAVEEVDAIASIDGVDCLFVGPADLTHALGVLLQTDHRSYRDAVEAVGKAAARHGKATGVLVRSREEFQAYRELGFTLIAFGSDTGFLVAGARASLEATGRA
jgi:2-keto-3-deoxy-L-rhamnonate aldolase RhmA